MAGKVLRGAVKVLRLPEKVLGEAVEVLRHLVGFCKAQERFSGRQARFREAQERFWEVQLRFYIAQNLDCFPQNLFKIMNLSTSETFSAENQVPTPIDDQKTSCQMKNGPAPATRRGLRQPFQINKSSTGATCGLKKND
jgi:hypothetical protein